MEIKEKIIKSPDLIRVLGKEHENKWVALSVNYKKVLAIGDNLPSILKAVPQREKVVMKVLPNLSYAPLTF